MKRFLILLLLTSSACFSKSATNMFFEPNIKQAILSPSGEHVALVQGGLENQILRIHIKSTGQVVEAIDAKAYQKEEAKITSVQWVDDKVLAIEFVSNTRGIKDLLDTKRKTETLFVSFASGFDAAPKILKVYTKGWIIDPLPQEPGKFLYAKSGSNSRVYKLSVDKLHEYGKRLGKFDKHDGGQFRSRNELVRVKGYAIRWFMGQGNKPVSVTYYDREGKLTLAKIVEDSILDEPINVWTFYTEEEKRKREEKRKKYKKNSDANKSELLTSNFEQYLIPIRLAPGKSRFYGVDLNSDEQRKIYILDYEAQTAELAYETHAYRISTLITDADTHELTAVNLVKNTQIVTDYLERVNVDSDDSKSAEINAVIAQNLDKNTELLYRESYNNPGTFVIQQADKVQVVGHVYPKLEDSIESVQQIGKVDVSGLEIPYILSKSSQPTNEPFPLVVLPHGGPIGVYDSQYFDLETQYLVSQGFAVLRVNYRGSGGYDKSFVEAGKKQWGDLILKDIHETSLVVSQRDDIDDSRVCIAGISYGGYAAIMLSMQYPDFYRCAVTVAGVTDVPLMLASTKMSEAQVEWTKEYIGDLSQEFEKLVAISPVYQASKFKNPILIMHGTDDDIVDLEHSYRLRHVLERNGKPFEWKIYEGENHHFKTLENRRDMFQTMSDFLKANLNGKS